MGFKLFGNSKNEQIAELKKDVEALTQFSSLQSIDENLFNILNSTSLKSTSFNDDVLIEMWEEVPEVSTVISKISNRAKNVPWKHFRITDSGAFESYQKAYSDFLNLKADYRTVKRFQDAALEPIVDKEVMRLLNNPNGLQSWSEMIEQLVNYYYVIGNSYLIKLGAFGFVPDEIKIMASQQTDVKVKDSFVKDPFQISKESPISKYTFNNGFGKEIAYDPELILHMKAPSLKYKNTAWRKGYSPLGAAVMATRTLKNEYLSRLSLVRDRGMMGMLVGNSKGGVGPTSEDTKKLYSRLQKFGLGDGKKNSFGATNGDYKWLNMSFNSGELELLKGREENLKVLCRKMNVPTDLLIGDSTFNNVTTAGKMIYTSNVMPLLDDLKEKLNPFIGITQNNEIIMPIYDDIAELQQDLKAQTDIMTAQYDSGLATRSEAREGVGRSAESETTDYKSENSNSNEIKPINTD